MNSDFQHGLIKLLDSTTKELQEELLTLIWDTEKTQRVEDSRYSNHLTDGLLYAWRWCYNYASQPLKEEPKEGTDEYMAQWWEKEAEKLAKKQRDMMEDEWT